MSYQRIGNYMVGTFIGGLGLFNSSKLEIRQATDTNAELIFQNGQIISATMMFVCFAGIMGEFLVMKTLKNKIPSNDVFGTKVKLKKIIKKNKDTDSQEEWENEGGMINRFDPIPQDNPKFRSKKDNKTIFSSPKIKYKKIRQNKERVTISPVDETDSGE